MNAIAALDATAPDGLAMESLVRSTLCAAITAAQSSLETQGFNVRLSLELGTSRASGLLYLTESSGKGRVVGVKVDGMAVHIDGQKILMDKPGSLAALAVRIVDVAVG